MGEKIKDYINKLAEEKNIKVSNDTNLFDAGILDSLGVVNLLVYIGETLEFDLNIEELNSENFTTIDTITSFLSRRVQ